MEYLQRGSLEDEAKGAYVPLTRAKRLIIDVMRGLEHAHSQGILHRDIKPANILVGEGGEGKLSDFGLAIPMGIDPTALGMKDYNYVIHQAPEIVRTTDYYIGTDIYACGVTLYRLVNGDSVLPTVPVNEIRGLTQDGKFPDHTRYRDFVPRPLRVIINRAMNVDPSRRFQSASEMRHAVEQVKIEKNWSERILMNGVEWTCGWNRKCYEVSRRCGPNNRWEVLVQKGTAKRALRKIGALCRYDTTEAEAERHARRVLQDFVLGKQK
jgi:serine/threonine protein kinase